MIYQDRSGRQVLSWGLHLFSANIVRGSHRKPAPSDRFLPAQTFVGNRSRDLLHDREELLKPQSSIQRDEQIMNIITADRFGAPRPSLEERDISLCVVGIHKAGFVPRCFIPLCH